MSVKCPKCHQENPDTQKFCGECASPLQPSKDIKDTETLETPKEELTTGSTFAGRYQIIEELGRGGMGKVYKVLDKEVNAKIALKLIKPEISSDKKTIERFRNELKVARDIAHKNVCRMYDLGKEEGAYFITMEYVSGEDLKSFIRRSGVISIGKAISIAIQVCEGLLEAHRLGVVHRDLKPQNIMIDKDGNARIMDFGIARSLRTKSITGSGVMIGTPEYMSPEQVDGKEADLRADIYSLGVILYEMVTGRIPFEGDTPFSIGVKQKSEVPRAPKEINEQIPEDLNRVILKCMEKEKEKRYQGVSELNSELMSMQEGIPTTERILPERKPLTSKEITVRFSLKKIFVPAFIVIAVIIIGIVAWQLLPEKEAVPIPPDLRSIAVLPFADLSPQKDQEYFCDGMTDEIIAKLSRLDGWKVIPRTSMMRFKNTTKDIEEIGQELDVAAILEGSVRKEEQDLRIITTLINVSDSSQLWSATYNQKLDSVFMIQSDIAEKITDALKMELSPEEKERLEKKPTESLTAYDYYLKGREYYRRYLKQDNEQAIKLFKKALEVDKDYALAYAGLGDAYAQGSYRFGSSSTWLDLAIDASQTAISLDPDCAEAHKALGLAYFYKGWIRKAINVLEKSIDINPHLDTAISNLAINNLFIGEVENGLPYAQKNLALTPSDPWAYHIFALFYYALDDLAKMEQWTAKSLELKPDFIDANVLLICSNLVQRKIHEAVENSQKLLSMLPHDIFPIIWAGETALFAGDIPKARQYYQKVVELFPEHVNSFTGINNTTRLGYIYWISGEKDEAQKLFNNSLSYAQEQIENGNEFWGLRFDTAAIYAVQGNKEEAYKWLKKSIEKGFLGYRFCQIEPMFKNLHNDENFKQIMAEGKGLINEMRERVEIEKED